MSKSLLPQNSTAFERSLEDVMETALNIPVDGIRQLWRPRECPVELLPWLAWSFSVDEWDTYWDEETKRAVIENSLYIHRHKGTKAAVLRALKLAHVDQYATLTEWFEQNGSGIPRTFFIDIPADKLSTDERQQLLLKLVDTAKPVSAHQKMRLLAEDGVLQNTIGDTLLPTVILVDSRLPMIEKVQIETITPRNVGFNSHLKQSETEIFGFNSNLSLLAVQPQILTLNYETRPPLADRWLFLVRPRPDGEIESGILKVALSISVETALSELFGHIVQNDSPQIIVNCPLANTFELFSQNTALSQAKESTLISVIQRKAPPVGEIIDGTVNVNYQFVHSHKFGIAIEYVQKAENPIVFRGVHAKQLHLFLTNTAFKTKENPPPSLLKPVPTFEGEIRNGTVFVSATQTTSQETHLFIHKQQQATEEKQTLTAAIPVLADTLTTNYATQPPRQNNLRLFTREMPKFGVIEQGQIKDTVELPTPSKVGSLDRIYVSRSYSDPLTLQDDVVFATVALSEQATITETTRLNTLISTDVLAQNISLKPTVSNTLNVIARQLPFGIQAQDIRYGAVQQAATLTVGAQALTLTHSEQTHALVSERATLTTETAVQSQVVITDTRTEAFATTDLSVHTVTQNFAVQTGLKCHDSLNANFDLFITALMTNIKPIEYKPAAALKVFHPKPQGEISAGRLSVEVETATTRCLKNFVQQTESREMLTQQLNSSLAMSALMVNQYFRQQEKTVTGIIRSKPEGEVTLGNLSVAVSVPRRDNSMLLTRQSPKASVESCRSHSALTAACFAVVYANA